MDQTIQAWRAEKIVELREAEAELEALRRDGRWHMIAFCVVMAIALCLAGFGIWGVCRYGP